MDRELAQLRSDSEDAMNHAGQFLTSTGLALCDLVVLLGAAFLVLHGWIARRRLPRQSIVKILSDPERRAREAGL